MYSPADPGPSGDIKRKKTASACLLGAVTDRQDQGEKALKEIQAIKKFKRFLQTERGLSPNSIYSYTYDLKEIQRFPVAQQQGHFQRHPRRCSAVPEVRKEQEA
jgi:hypothetical protein